MRETQTNSSGSPRDPSHFLNCQLLNSLSKQPAKSFTEAEKRYSSFSTEVRKLWLYTKRMPSKRLATRGPGEHAPVQSTQIQGARSHNYYSLFWMVRDLHKVGIMDMAGVQKTKRFWVLFCLVSGWGWLLIDCVDSTSPDLLEKKREIDQVSSPPQKNTGVQNMSNQVSSQTNSSLREAYSLRYCGVALACEEVPWGKKQRCGTNPGYAQTCVLPCAGLRHQGGPCRSPGKGTSREGRGGQSKTRKKTGLEDCGTADYWATEELTESQCVQLL